jgi:hypothetical protein
MDSTILPSTGTGAVVNSGGHHHDRGVLELITNNNIADGGRAILGVMNANASHMLSSTTLNLKAIEESKLETSKAMNALSCQISELRAEQKEQHAQTRQLMIEGENKRLSSENADLRMRLLLGKKEV